MMDNKQRKHIKKIRDDFVEANQRIKDSLNNSIKALAEDLYSKDTHFIFELIQNAEDNEYEEEEPSISFLLSKNDPTNTQGSDGALIIKNNEVGFSPENVDAVCAVGKSTKQKAQGYIGEKGIGFKSVFRVTTVPHVFSNGYRFCLPESDAETGLGYIVPQWVEEIPDDIDPCVTTIVLPLDKDNFDYAKIKKMVCDIKLETILFLSKLKEVKIDTGKKLEILKDDSNLPKVEIWVNDESKNKPEHVDEFLLYSRNFPKPDDINHEKRKDIKEREVSIAFLLNKDTVDEGRIFAYLPVHSGTGLPFSINADFLLTSSRENIHWDYSWNKWLMTCVATLLCEALPQLKEAGRLTIERLDALTKCLNNITDEHAFYPIVDAVCNAFKEHELLPTDDGGHVSAKNAKLVRGAELRKLLGDRQRQALFPEQSNFKWLSTEITQDKTRDLHQYLTNKLGVKEMTPNSFVREITPDFLEQQSNEWMIELYQFFHTQPAQDSILKYKPFIRLHNGSHDSPFKKNDSLNVYLPPQEDTTFPVVKREICKDEKTMVFLKRLGLTEPDTVAEVIDYILPKYSQNHAHIYEDEHVEDMKKILQAYSTYSQTAYSTDSQTKKQSLIDHLTKTAFIRAENKALKPRPYKKPDQVYFQNDELLLYFDGNPDVWFVSSKYNETVNNLFSGLNIKDVKDVIEVVNKDPNSSFNTDMDVIGLECALDSPTTKKSLFIWGSIAIANAKYIRGTIVEKSSKKPHSKSRIPKKNQPSRFGSLLINKPWLPDKEGTFHKPSELKLDELPDSFEKNETLANQLEMKKDLDAKLTKLAEEMGIPSDRLQFVKDNPDKIEKLMEEDNVQQPSPKFPSRASDNPVRRQEHTEKQINNAQKKEYKPKTINERISRKSIDPKTFLSITYTNDDGQMICQVCEKEMPFKKLDGEYYFEKREVLSIYPLPQEHEAQHLALCPLCAAKYKYFILNPQNKKEQLRIIDALKKAEKGVLSIPISLGEENAKLRFVETHFADLKTIIKKLTLEAAHD